MKKKVLITGVNGFLGRSLTDSLDTNKYYISGLDLDKEFSGSKGILENYYPIDISRPFHLDKDFDIVLHLAACNRTNRDNKLDYDIFEKINVFGTANVIHCCKFKRFLFLSTSKLYKRLPGLINEQSSLNPVSYYERSKCKAESVCRNYVDDKKLVIVRPVNITGIHQDNNAIVPAFFRRAVRGETIQIFVRDNSIIQFLSVKDVADALDAMMCREEIYGVFNLSNNDSITIGELAEKIVAICNSSSEILYLNEAEKDDVEIDSSKAIELLKWRPKVLIGQMLKDYGAYYLRTSR